MSGFLPIDEIQKELRDARTEFLAASESLQREQEKLEEELIASLERQKTEDLKKKLYA